MHIPGASTSSAQKRHVQFVASSTQGVLVTVYAATDTGHTSPLASSATNVAPGSTACGGTVGARTCTIVIPAPAGSDAFVFTTYDQPPITGTTTFPAGANLLATGVVPNQTITVGQANTVNVTLGGTLSYFFVNPFGTQLLAGVSGQTAAISITAIDAGGNAIIGSYTDSNGNPNPIALTVQETSGAGFTTIAVDGGTPGATATVTQSSDTIAIHYNGGGNPGYFATINAVAASGQSQNPTFDPVFLSATPASALTIAAAPTINVTNGQTVTINYNAQNFGTIQPSFNAYSCGGIALLTAPAPATGAVGSFTISDLAGGNCVVALSLGYTTTIALNVTAAGSASANVAVPGTTLAYLPLGAAGVAIENEAGTVLGTVATTAGFLALDDAGNLYTIQSPPSGNTGPGVISLYTPGGSTYPPTYTLSANTYAPSDPNYTDYIQAAGNGELIAMAFDSSASKTVIDMWNPGTSGAPTHTVTYSPPNGQGIAFFGGIDHAGNVYVTYYKPCADNANLTCAFYDVLNSAGSVVRTIPETIVPEAEQSSFTPNYFAVGPDGTFYVAENTDLVGDPLAGLYIYPPSGPERIAPNGASAPLGVDLDAAGNIYVANTLSAFNGTSWATDTLHTISVLSPDAGTVLRNVSVPPGPVTVTVAGDGTVYASSFVFGGTTGSTYVIPAAEFTTQQIASSPVEAIVLWDGTRTTLSRVRAPQSLGHGSAHASGAFFRSAHLYRH